MTAATIAYDQPTSAPAMWGTDIKSQQEVSYNNYWASIYQYTQELKDEVIIKLLQSLSSYIAKPKISQKNLEAIRILNQWFAEPDNLGEEFWKEFCEDLEKNRFKIGR